MITKRFKRTNRLLLLPILLSSLALTGCGDLVEIQDRDFVQALGISYEGNQYEITFGLPVLNTRKDNMVPSDEERLVRTYDGSSLSEIEQRYNMNSENRLDFRHLQVIVLDRSLCMNSDAMKDLLIEIDDKYDISHNVLVYFYEANVRDLIGMTKTAGSIGDYLKKLNRNNQISRMESLKIAALIDSRTNERTLFIPALSYQDHSIAVDGGVFLCKNHIIRQISQSEADFYFMTLGKGKQSFFRISEEQLVQLEHVSVKTTYEPTKDSLEISLLVTGKARVFLSGAKSEDINSLKEQMDAYFEHHLTIQAAEYMKEEHLDYLNLYDKSSYLNRQVWMHYVDRTDDFIDDATIRVSVDIHYE